MKFVGIFTLLLLICASSGFAQVPPSSGDIVYLSQEENQFYLLINQFRSSLGLPTLQIHVSIQNAAKKHSTWMRAQDAAKKHAAWMTSQSFLTHFGPEENITPFQRMMDEGYTNYTYLGENIACGNGDATKTFRQWIFSPTHLANMLNPHFHHMGISRVGTGNEYCPFYWTNDFGSLTDPQLDPAEITDLQKITAAVESISGPIPAGKKVLLPTEAPEPVNLAEANETPAPTPSSNNIASLIQCMVPYSLAKDILTFIPNTDALMEITPNNMGEYKAKVSYLQNGAAANLYPLAIDNVSVIKNSTYPLLLIFANSVNRGNGFMIQFDTNKSSAQFDVYPTSGASGSVLCTVKY